MNKIQLPQYPINSMDSTTKVRDLIEALQKVDPEKFVYTEGCDCTGDVASISEDEKSVLIER